jgi:lysozyme
MRTSATGLELLRSFEGFRPRAARLADGRWLIGHGHTATARQGLQISERDALLILRHHDLPPVEQMISELVLSPLSQNEFDALVSFAFNLGADAFAGSDVVSALNAGDRAKAADAMWAWRLANVSGELRVIDALARRRAAEIALFLEPQNGRVPVTGALVRPLVQRGHDDEETASSARSVVISPRQEKDETRNSDSSTQAAARAVSERIARLLGEAPAQPPSPPLPPPAPGDGPTPEEITDALKALVGEDPASPPPPQTPPVASGRAKGPPEGIERRRVPRPPSDNGGPEDPNGLPPLPPAESVIVDDLEIIQIDQRDLERAIRENGEHDTAAIRNLGAWMPYALLSGLGLVGFVSGVQRFLVQASQPVLRAGDAYAGPVLALGGGFLFVISAYYLFRALTRQD